MIVVWLSAGSDGDDSDGTSIQAQRLDSFGDPVGAEFQVNTLTTGDSRKPDVAMDAAGNFVIAWHNSGAVSPEVDGYSIWARRYNSVGSAQGSEFQVNTYTTNAQRAPTIALDQDGDFVVSWHSWGSPGDDSEVDSVQIQRFRANATRIGGQVQANQYTTNYQAYPAVAMDADGNFIVTWTSSGSFGTDQDSYSVSARRFERVEPIYLPIVNRP